MVDSSEPRSLDRRELDHLLTRVQDGVVSRRQLVELGARAYEIRRLLRRGELVVVHPGVYVGHNGPLTRAQREWAAVLAHWPAALARRSALHRSSDGPVHVAIDRKRRVVAVPGVVAHRSSHLDERIWWQRCPPVMKIEHAAIDVAAEQADIVASFRVFADVVQTRETSARAIAAALRERHGVPNKPVLLELLEDLATGACSVLEREYLRLADAHGLPNSEADGVRRQLRSAGDRTAYRDVVYEPYDFVVELDGRVFHDNAAARDRDAARDLETLVVEDRTTVRLTYGQVLRDGCRTMSQVGLVLRRRGWAGSVVGCPDCTRGATGWPVDQNS